MQNAPDHSLWHYLVRRNHALAALAALLMGASGSNLHAATFSDHNWTSMGGYPGANDLVHATVVDASGNLYIAGAFTIVGDVFATNIAKWNGTNWSALGSGLQANDRFWSDVYALAVSGNDLYVAGHFTMAGGVPANSIAKWNGTNWSALGSGMNGYVSALAVSGNDVYASGAFTNAGGNAVNYIAKWNGSSWSALGSGLNRGADSLVVSGSDLYVGGSFTNAGGITVNRIAKWNGSSWSALGSGVQGVDYMGNPGASVSALAVSGNDLYVAGNFSTAGGIAATNMAKWNGSSWSAFPWPIWGASEMAVWGGVRDLTVSGNDLYAAGVVEVGTIWASSYQGYVVKWNGTNWSALEPGMDGSWHHEWDAEVMAVAVSGTNVYAGGAFTIAGNSTAHCLARWNGSHWSALGSVYGHVSALTASGRDVYGAHLVTAADGTQSDYIAKWDGANWSTLGSGMSEYGYVYALAVSGNDLYAGGEFTTAGGVPANGIAKWNGSSWSALGPGVPLGVWALAVSGSNVYAGGYVRIGGPPFFNCIAKWNGSNWSALGSGVGGGDPFLPTVYALVVSGNDLYAGGIFTMAGGVPANRIAKWNGSSWSALGSGMNEHVYAIAVSGSDVYAGGVFTTAGGSPANRIAKWNGTNWSALGLGMNRPVEALAVVGGDLYAAGQFTTAGGIPANYIAKWNGNSWSALGSGMDYGVGSLAASSDELFAAGGFTTAGGKVSPYLARARIGSAAQAVAASNTTASIRFSGVTGFPYDVQRATNLTPPITWTTVSTVPLYPAADGSFTFSDTNATSGAAYYRAQLNNVDEE